jgi:hypothetical protein
MLRAAGGGATPRLLAASAVAVPLTGTLTETVLATVTVPGGAMGTNGGVLIYSTWTVTNNANNKQVRIRFGGTAGTQHLTQIVTTAATLGDVRRIRNRGAANSQVGSFSSSQTGLGTSAGAVVTSTVDTSVAADLVFSGQLANVADSVVLENYEVWLLP